MGFEYNGQTIKSTDDLRDAILIEHTKDRFISLTKGMIERWGLDFTLAILGGALCGIPEANIEPALKFKKRFVKSDKYDDDILEDIK